MSSNLQIDFAQKSDVPLILSFIKELAEYEKLLHEVQATEESLEKTLIGDKVSAEVIIAYYDKKPAGFALFFHTYSTFLAKPGLYLEDLYVKNDFRGKGIGKRLFEFLGDLAQKRGCGRLEWWVLNWNRPAIDFYESLGAEAMDEWTVYRLSGKSLGDLNSIDS